MWACANCSLRPREKKKDISLRQALHLSRWLLDKRVQLAKSCKHWQQSLNSDKCPLFTGEAGSLSACARWTSSCCSKARYSCILGHGVVNCGGCVLWGLQRIGRCWRHSRLFYDTPEHHLFPKQKIHVVRCK